MKKNIHPQYNKVNVQCVCGNKFQVESSIDKIEVEICAKCHPFYTGEQKIIDTANRVKSFNEKQKRANTYKNTEKEKILNKEKIQEKKNLQSRPTSLRDMMQSLSQ